MTELILKLPSKSRAKPQCYWNQWKNCCSFYWNHYYALYSLSSSAMKVKIMRFTVFYTYYFLGFRTHSWTSSVFTLVNKVRWKYVSRFVLHFGRKYTEGSLQWQLWPVNSDGKPQASLQLKFLKLHVKIFKKFLEVLKFFYIFISKLLSFFSMRK